MNDNLNLQEPKVSYGATSSMPQHDLTDDDDSYEIRPSHSYPISLQDNSDQSENDNDSDAHPSYLSERLLSKTCFFSLAHDVDRGYRGTELNLLNFSRPHMRAFHGSWLCYFLSSALQFAVCPLLPEIASSLKLTKRDVWLSNIWSMVGGIPMGFLLGPLCDQYGARILVTSLLTCCAIPCLCMGFVSSLKGLVVARTVIGSMDTFVPGQFWITSMFTRQVVGTAMAISGGWGASGAGFVQLAVGSIIFPTCVSLTNGNTDLAWRLSLIVPALLALSAAAFFFKYSDDCPLGNYRQVKKAGLMMERSAVDSFRSGAMNINSWILFLQYAGSCGVDLTMCNGTAIYYHERFHQPIAAAGAIAFLYGISSIYARGIGGYVSDTLGDRYSLKGRLVAQMACMIVQGLLCVGFAHTKALGGSILVMFAFSILIQMSMGTCFGIVSYVDGPNTGTVAGIVGSGGNVGAVWLGRVFMANESYSYCMEYMGWFTVVLAFLTPLIVVKGYKGLLFGKEDVHGEPHVSLMVPS